jgi:CubicO group peptidase (beta-lactamase class C family)
MARPRIQTLALLGVLAVGLVILFVVGLWAYMSLTSKPLHPSSQEVPTVASQASQPRWTSAVERSRQILKDALAEQNVPGLSVAVGVGGELAWAEGFGWADLENRVRVTPEMRFRLGTASMALTSAAAGLLVEQGRLKLDEEIQAYVPEYPKKQWPVTLRQLMGHRAGLRTDGGDEGPFGEHCGRAVEGLKLFKDQKLLFEPGTAYRFSTFGWILVSAAIEAAAGESIYTFMRDRIFEPLGMKDTRPDSVTEPVANRVTFYFPRFAADNRYGMQFAPRQDYSCYAGAYAFLSTPTDLVRFAIAINGGKLLQPATVQSLQTSQRLSSGQETGYGLGWDLETVELSGRQTRTVGHDGNSVGGMVASLITFPDHPIVVAMMTNTSWVDTFSLAMKIAEAFAEPQKTSAGG